MSQSQLAAVPEATADTVAELVAADKPRLRYGIPGDIDRLMEEDPDRGVEWRSEMRVVLSTLMTTKTVRTEGAAPGDPTGIHYETRPGRYQARGFVTLTDDRGNRDSQYVIERIASD